ncbi:hypothetical protein FJTKL_07740 [Diaporthe vaccinii]|uniref:Uncharacterized protein n=1 Tax=Diaporthe vaccinii TaxID=105482 RepID=A0ABR4FD49_9PEZI
MPASDSKHRTQYPEKKKRKERYLSLHFDIYCRDPKRRNAFCPLHQHLPNGLQPHLSTSYHNPLPPPNLISTVGDPQTRLCTQHRVDPRNTNTNITQNFAVFT